MSDFVKRWSAGSPSPCWAWGSSWLPRRAEVRTHRRLTIPMLPPSRARGLAVRSTGISARSFWSSWHSSSWGSPPGDERAPALPGATGDGGLSMGIDWDSLRESEFPVTGAGLISTMPPPLRSPGAAATCFGPGRRHKRITASSAGRNWNGASKGFAPRPLVCSTPTSTRSPSSTARPMASASIAEGFPWRTETMWSPPKRNTPRTSTRG